MDSTRPEYPKGSSSPSTTGSAAHTVHSDLWLGRTRWSLVRLAATRDDPDARRAAFEALLERYRVPIERTLAYHLRRHPRLEASVEDFFSHLFLNGALERADPTRGRFRQFIQGVIRIFVLEETGRGRARPSIDLEACEPTTPSADAALEQEEERLWAQGLLESALAELDRLAPTDAALLRRRYLAQPSPDTAALCAELALDPPTLLKRLSRARQRLRPLILDAIRESTSDAPDFADERTRLLARLFEASPGLLTEAPPRSTVRDQPSPP